jgi:hypothetical protein
LSIFTGRLIYDKIQTKKKLKIAQLTIGISNFDDLWKYLPENLIGTATNFSIPKDFLIRYTDIVILLLESVSIDNINEKQSRFDLYPSMNNEQIEKLRDILAGEKEKLNKIEKQ